MTHASKAGGDLGPGTATGNEAGATSPARAKTGKGQRVSEERGASHRSKKNPGKRAAQGGASR
jgi:hypothetical protein